MSDMTETASGGAIDTGATTATQSGEGQTIDYAAEYQAVVALRKADQLRSVLHGIHEDLLELPAITGLAQFDAHGTLTAEAVTALGQLRTTKPHFFASQSPAVKTTVAQPQATQPQATQPQTTQQTQLAPTTPAPAPVPTTGPQYLSLAEMQAVMADPARKNDPVWRNKVAESWTYYKGRVNHGA